MECKKIKYDIRLHSEILRNLVEGIYLIRMSDLEIVWANPKFEEMFGYNPGEMIGQRAIIVNAPTDKAPEETAAEIVTVLEKTGEWHGEVNNIKKDGTSFWCYANVSIFNHPEFGEVLVAVHTDISKRKKAEQKLKESEEKCKIILEHKKAEQQLKESEEKLRTFMDSATDGFFLYDSELNIVDVNKAGLSLWPSGTRKEDLIGKNMLDFAAKIKKSGRYDKYMEVIKSGEPFFAEDVSGHPEFGDIHLMISAFKVGEGMGLISTNITERKKIKQRLRESEEKYQEAYNLVNFYKDLFVHDMNNILQSIVSIAEYHSYFRNEPEKIKRFGDISKLIKEQVGRGSSLISKVRKLSKLEETEINLVSIGIFDVLNKSVENTKNSFYDKNIKIQIKELFKDLKVLGDDLLIYIFDNILINAIKFSDGDKEIIVDILISRFQEEDNNYIKFEFKDKGTGIPDIRKKTLFHEPYESDISKRGMGMGLFLVKKIVDKYGGKIWVENRIQGDYKKGSNFIVLLRDAQNYLTTIKK